MLFSNTNLPNSSFKAVPKLDTGSKLNLRQLEARVNKLELIVEALWEILKKDTHLEEADLI